MLYMCFIYACYTCVLYLHVLYMYMYAHVYITMYRCTWCVYALVI